MEFSMRLNMLKEKEMKLAEYNKMIDETDKTYLRVATTYFINIDCRNNKQISG